MDWSKLKAWIIATGIGIAAFFGGKVTTSNATGLYYTGGLNAQYQPQCRDYDGNLKPCSGTPLKAQWIWAQDWAVAHGDDFIDWGHIQYNQSVHCSTSYIHHVRNSSQCKCIATGMVLPCPPVPTPKP